jgi:metal-sulfur cluster biosynthetic enzyme
MSETKVVWQVESTHPDLSEPLREGLQEVIDPEIGLNIVELGLVRDIEINDDQVKMTMILTTPFCPYGPALLEMARKKAEEAISKPVTLEMGMETWDFSMMEEGAGGDWGLY